MKFQIPKQYEKCALCADAFMNCIQIVVCLNTWDFVYASCIEDFLSSRFTVMYAWFTTMSRH